MGLRDLVTIVESVRQGRKLSLNLRSYFLKKKSTHTSQVAHSLVSVATSPLQGFPPPPALNSPAPIYIPGWREGHCESKVSCQRTQHNIPGQGLNPESSMLTMRLLCLTGCSSSLRMSRKHFFVP